LVCHLPGPSIKTRCSSQSQMKNYRLVHVLVSSSTMLFVELQPAVIIITVV
jgi:hypothetical protein